MQYYFKCLHASNFYGYLISFLIIHMLRAILFLSNTQSRLILTKKTSIDWGVYTNCRKPWQSFLRALFLGRTKHF